MDAHKQGSLHESMSVVLRIPCVLCACVHTLLKVSCLVGSSLATHLQKAGFKRQAKSICI